MSAVQARIQTDVKQALKDKAKERLLVLRMILAALKQIEVDERIELDDARVLQVLDKMVKQRREAITQYQAGKREDLAAKEQAEITIIQAYLPAQLSMEEIAAEVDVAIASCGEAAAGPQLMGQVMAALKPKLQGRADMKAVSQLVKERLQS